MKNKDSKGEKYYLILQGQVGIYIRPPKSISKSEKKPKQQKKKEDNSTENKLDKDENKKYSDESQDCLQFKKNSHLDELIMVKQLSEGQTFGEMALIYNQPRLATIHTFQETVLAVLTKRDFRLIMKKAEMRQIKGELKFLKQVYLFHSWSYENLRDIYLNSEQIQFQKGQIVFKEDDSADSIYIIKRGSFLIGQLGEYDVFGEEEFVSLINQIFKENESEQNSYFDQKNQQFEQFIVENQKTKRFSSVTCDSRDGGVLIRIKINDYILRILNYSETRKTALNSIKQKIALHSQVHERNCETFVIYQKYLIRGDPKLQSNSLSSLVCQNSIYSNNTIIEQPTSLHINSDRKRGLFTLDNPMLFDQINITKDMKQNNNYNKKNLSNERNNQNGRGSSRTNTNYQIKEIQNEDQDDAVQGIRNNNCNSVKSNSVQKKVKKYKFQFTSEQIDDSIFTEKIPENIKQIHQERQKQKYEALQIYKYEQTNYQKVQLNHFKIKYQQNQPTKQNGVYKCLEPLINNRIEKLGYKLTKLKGQETEKQSGDYFSIEDSNYNQQTQRNEICSLMQITSCCGENWANNSIDLKTQNQISPQIQKTKINFPLNNEKSTPKKIESLSQQMREKIRLKPLIMQNPTHTSIISSNKKNSLNFNNFYNGETYQQQKGSITDYVYNNGSLQVSPKRKFIKSNNILSENKQNLNRSYDIYHPINLSRERNQMNSRDWQKRQQYVHSLLTEFQSRSVSLSKTKLLSCNQIPSLPKLEEQTSTKDTQIPQSSKIISSSRQKGNIFQFNCITDSI